MAKLADRVVKDAETPVREVSAGATQDLATEISKLPAVSTSKALVPVKASPTSVFGRAISIDVPEEFNFTEIREQAQAAQPALFTQDGIEQDNGPRMTLKDLSTTRSDVFHVPLSVLHVEEGWNSRDMTAPKFRAKIKWLAENIAVNGVLAPLEVAKKDGRYIILDGHCRYFAAMLALKNGATTVKTVKCITPSRGVQPELHYLSQILRNSGTGLNPIEMGDVMAKLIEEGLSPEQIAEKVSRRTRDVIDLLELRETPKQVREWVSHEKLSATLAIGTWRNNPEKKAIKLMAKMVEEAEAQNLPKVNRTIANKVTGKAVTLAKPLREVDTILRAAEVIPDPVTGKTAIILDAEVYKKLLALGLLAPVEATAEGAAGDDAEPEVTEQSA